MVTLVTTTTKGSVTRWMMLPILIVELIEQIASNLNRQDVCSLRLTCRSLAQKSQHIFGKVCLSEWSTDLSLDDLLRLEDLASSEYFASYLRKLYVKCEAQKFGDGFDWDRHHRGYLTLDQVCSQRLRDLLLGPFRNCRSFNIHSVVSDGKGKAIAPTDAIGILLGIIAETGLAVESFTIDFRSQGFGRLDSSRLHMPQYLTPNFSKAWSNLAELEIEHSLTEETFDATLELLLQARNLRKLTLNLGGDCSCRLLEQLATAKTLRGLRELELYSLSLTAAQIDGLLCESKDTLRSLSLWFLNLQRDRDWSTILREIQSNHSRLEYISVFWLTLGTGLTSPAEVSLHVTFPLLTSDACQGFSNQFKVNNKKHRGHRRNYGASYRGLDSSKALGALADSVELI